MSTKHSLKLACGPYGKSYVEFVPFFDKGSNRNVVKMHVCAASDEDEKRFFNARTYLCVEEVEKFQKVLRAVNKRTNAYFHCNNRLDSIDIVYGDYKEVGDRLIDGVEMTVRNPSFNGRTPRAFTTMNHSTCTAICDYLSHWLNFFYYEEEVSSDENKELIKQLASTQEEIADLTLENAILRSEVDSLKETIESYAGKQEKKKVKKASVPKEGCLV